MSNDPWDLPVEKASRKKLVQLLKSYEKAGKMREAGICCSRLANLEKQFGPFQKSADYGQKAVSYLRQSDDKKELSRALRAACVPFMGGIDQAAYLRESLALAREAGSRLEEAHTIYRYTRALSPSPDQMKELEKLVADQQMIRYQEIFKELKQGHTVEEALAIYEELDYKSGIAMCLVSIGVERNRSDRNHSDRALFDRAVRLYLEAGETEAARKALMMADVFAPLPQPWDLPDEPGSREILMCLVEEYRQSKQRRERGICLARLSKMTMLFGPLDGGKTSLELARESLKCFSKSKRGTEYCIALEQAVEVVTDPAERRRLLEELVSYAEEIGEGPILSRALFKLATQFPDSGRTVSEALELFEDLGDTEGIGSCKEWMP